MPRKKDPNLEAITQQYRQKYEAGMSLRDIAAEFGVSAETVSQRLKAIPGFEFRSKTQAKLNYYSKIKSEDKETEMLFDLYMGIKADGTVLGEPMSIEDIAKLTSRSTKDIETELWKLDDFKTQRFFELYEEGLSWGKISEITGFSEGTIGTYLSRHPDYKPRTMNKAMRLNRSRVDLDFDQLIVGDYKAGMGRTAIATKYKNSQYVKDKGYKSFTANHVLRILQRHKIELRSYKEAASAKRKLQCK